MDISPYLELKAAPCAVFDALAERRTRARFMVPTPAGDFAAVTWGAYAQEIRAMTAFLHARGVRAGDRVAVYGPNSVSWAVAALAAQSLGGVLVPVYAGNTADQAAYVLEHSGAKAVFVDTPELTSRLLRVWPRLEAAATVVGLAEGLDLVALVTDMRERGEAAPTLAGAAPRLVRWGAALALGEALDRETPATFDRALEQIDLEQPALMLYTSGTTGHPKAVPLTHTNVGVNGRDWLQCLQKVLPDQGIDLLSLPFSHIFGLGELCIGNALGWTSYLADPWTALSKLPLVRPNVFFGVPSYWEKLAKMAMGESTPKARGERLRDVSGGAMRFCLSGGAGLSRDVKTFFHEHGIVIIEGYGLTEASPTLTMNRPDDFDFETVGKPFPSVELKLAADGEILARGPSIFGGYDKDPAATREAFTPDGWLKTGDIGQFTERGFLKIVDRKKDILVTAGGKNVPPANIELRFRGDPLIDHVVVYGDAKRYLVAGVWVNEREALRVLDEARVAADSRAPYLEKLLGTKIEAINATLARHETIKRFVMVKQPLTVDNGLLTSSLKIRRKAVYEVFRAELEALYVEETRS
jgi:long-chain acyl-CoA synthetase